MQRSYTERIALELSENRQMLFVSGPRQVGKTTIARALCETLPGLYFNWDDISYRQDILAGSDKIATQAQLDRLSSTKTLLVFDELHKFRRWKDFLKGLFDRYEQQAHILVTGSARLDIFRKGGDSLMGRYFHLRMHPLSIREILGAIDLKQLIQPPARFPQEGFDQLLRFGGFPEPFCKANMRFSRRWRKLRDQQLVQEDIRDGTNIQELAQLEVLTRLLQAHAGQSVRYSWLAEQVRVSVDTIRRWMDVLESFYFCFRVRPWSNNIASALRKEPKIYLWDSSPIDDTGKRSENFVACHLLKAVHWWTDLGLGDFELYYLRTKDQKEVDFLVTENSKPWFLTEVKTAKTAPLNPNLAWFQAKTSARHAFQVCLDMPFVERNCFEIEKPIKVPALTFLSQLV